MRLLDVSPGFNPENMLTFELSPSGDKYNEPPARVIFFQQVLDRLRALPGVESVALANDLPITGTDTTSNPRLEGREPFPPDQELLVGQHAVSHDYFEAMGIPLVSGRTFTERDVEGATRVIIVNETTARTLWPGEDPLGKRMRFSSSGPWDEVVGVVADVKHNGLDAKPSMESYSPYAQNPWGYSAIAVRARGEPGALTSAVRREIQAVDKDQPIHNVRVMDKVLSESVAPRRLSMVLFGLFAGVALVLSMVGIYGVMSYAVTQRTHEIGIRMALGAQTGDVLRLVVRQGMWLALIGIAAGLIAALALARVMDSLLYEVSATDPATFVAISLLLLGVALLANFVPARRASKVDPMIALRYE
ncbi:MAG TPA: FtsX-like permease family protein [Blastocatellia bacterium]|nr:FtsX-like permease family protein [Blastocatellia bacterium]